MSDDKPYNPFGRDHEPIYLTDEEARRLGLFDDFTDEERAEARQRWLETGGREPTAEERAQDQEWLRRQHPREGGS